MVHVQNATLAGGVALGTSANMPLEPWAAMLVGSIAGVISVLGYQYVTPFLKSRLKILDTCGVNNLHGMPGILAGIVGAVAAAMASMNSWGESMYEIFPLMAPMENTTEFKEIQHNFNEFHLEPSIGRSSIEQGGYQMLALTVTLGISIVGGALTGLLLRMPCLDNVPSKRMFDDDEFFVVEGEGYPEVLGTDGIEMHDEHDTKSPMLKA